MTSLFRVMLFALVGMVLTAYAVLQELNGQPGAAVVHRLVQSSPVLQGALFVPPAVAIAIAGITMLAFAIHRLGVLFKSPISRPRHLFPTPPVDRDSRRGGPAPVRGPVDDGSEEEEYGPFGAYDSPQHDRHRGNGQFDPRCAESYR